MNQTEKEALEKILASARESLDKLRPAMGQRHYVAGIPIGPESVETMYGLLIKTENALNTLISVTENKLQMGK